jgi:CubicO group peptidase (beta-lactamase class C family)
MRLELGNGKYGGKQLIKEDAIGETHVPIIMRGPDHITGKPGFYGLGWDIDYGEHGVVWGHGGAFSQGARTVVNLMPSEQLGIVVLSNAFPVGVPEAIAISFFDLVFDGKTSRNWIEVWNGVFDALFGRHMIEAVMAPYAKPPALPTPALPFAAYAENYANDYIGAVRVVEAEEGLQLEMGPDKKKIYPLTHFDRDLFLYAPFAETPD